ncbi:prepilin peptidase [Nanoarchaeota archaeon]
MIIDIVLVLIGLIGLIIASITDLKSREVPDWLNYSMIAAGLGLRLIYTVATLDIMYFMYGLLAFNIFFAAAIAMFYTGQWGGGDSKLLMAIGALFGTAPLAVSNALGFYPWYTIHFLFSFLINLLLVGALFGLFWSVLLSLKHWDKFFKEFKSQLSGKTQIIKQRVILLSMLIFILIIIFVKDSYFRLLIITLMVVILFAFYLITFVKSVEKTCMLKSVPPEKLTEGDWIAEEVKVNNKYICGPKDLGIEKHQIKQLIKFKKQKKIKLILIKEGIPFVPSFLIAFLITLLSGNLIFLIL